MNDLIKTAWKIGESNLKMQQDFLQEWTQLWSRPMQGLGKKRDPEAGWAQGISGTMEQLMEQQRDFVSKQFDSIEGSLDAIFQSIEKPKAKEPPKKVKKDAPAAPVAKQPVASPPTPAEEINRPIQGERNIAQKVAVVTGAASGIGEAVVRELVRRGAKCVLMVDLSDRVTEVATRINKSMDRKVAVAQVGDTTDPKFRQQVFDLAEAEHGLVTICVPAAGITRDALSVRVDKETGEAELYPVENFRQVTEVNLIAPIYWAIEMVARIAEDRAKRGLKRWAPEERVQGAIVFLGSVSSQGNKGQISYAVAKAGLEGAAATLMKEAIFHGVRCGIIHPGFTDTPMARALGEDYLTKNVLPFTQLRRLIRPEEIADAICFMISNSAVSGELWADAGWHPPA